jgi:hypothetical protein
MNAPLADKARIERLLRHAHLNLGDTDGIKIHNVLLNPIKTYNSPMLEFLDYMGQPENFWFTCKHLFGIELLPFQLAILQELWGRKFPMLIATRGGGKTWILALYAVLRAIFHQGAKIVVVGAAFRQSKFLFEYMESFYKNSPVFANLVGGGRGQGPKRDIDRCTFHIGQSEIIAIPLGDGTKIRGLRANYIIADEFSSIPQEIFEVVIKGFGAVAADVVGRVKEEAQISVLRAMGMYSEAGEMEEEKGFGNQTIISGTAYYAFNHFFEYFDRQRKIVNSKGNIRYLEDNVFHGPVPEGFRWDYYSAIRLPNNLLPRGFMDEDQLLQSRAMLDNSRYSMEYEAVFAKDSEGFYRRSLVERCVTNDPITLSTGTSVQFDAALRGNPNSTFVYGIDPAALSDNFSIVVLEAKPDHNRIVYVWTCSKQLMRERLKNKKDVTLQSFYTYCARKILDLMKIFPTEHIAIDGQGGGLAIIEALHDELVLQGLEKPLWPYFKPKEDDKNPFYWEKVDKVTDGEAGLHILHVIEFAKAEFTYNANHNLRKDFETQTTLFPKFDTILLAEAITQDKMLARYYDTLEDCVMEIEALKDELTTIEHTQTPSGRDKWDTPETIEIGGKKGRLRKDRYSALLMANEVAHVMMYQLNETQYTHVGGFVGKEFRNKTGQMYTGPDHLISKLQQLSGAGMGISRR